ncbi:6-hydroxy-D-nicotine oxidase [Verticillium alfalfae VaMs.102]|uniref:6-hydroxy-D-nicotine oxidase n=1 Tax=Verticillium alfalfae (strain VaMs.102 / ATCC MYA-4576 / FGSC 10136) TaxID=526221 RepID=C9SUD8_VERA1|nr:6-hydroxy-D-nicotine oxidase [Verticillium alfalfae VaMs.102]EEY22449.1 6-hydroxy-D-nicotine oxidase [Verticillium alfalfae VaMs.102]
MSLAARDCSDEGVEACEALLSAGLGDQVLAVADAAYEACLESWWSSSSRLRPACIARPNNAQNAATVVRVLGQNTTSNFAVRSGGHSHRAGGNNIDGGVTIDLGYPKATTYNTETDIASIEPASRWGDAFLALERSGVAVPGGRDSNVGIGGFLTGGGNSYYTGLYGFGCDSVVNAEIVLADGSIINANKYSHPDLLKAPKGGWGNFGIVTRFDLETFPSKPLWGSIRASEKSHTAAVGAAMVNFTAITTRIQRLRTLSISPTILECLQTSLLPKSSLTQVARRHLRFLTKPWQLQNSSTTLRSDPWVACQMTIFCLLAYSQSSVFNLGIGNANKIRHSNVWFTLTFKNDERVIRKSAELLEKLVAEMLQTVSTNELGTQNLFQPIPKFFAEIGEFRRGNVLGSTRSRGLPHVAPRLYRQEPKHETLLHEKGLEMKAALEEFAKSIDALQPWVYINYADPTQDPISNYGKAQR